MAKELPYFQFEPAEYLTKDISFCSLQVQGLFINICAYYWQRNCELTKSQLLRRLNYENELNELIKEGIIDVQEDNIIIKFLDIQRENAIGVSKKNSENGSKGGRPKKAKQNPNETQTKAKQNPNESHKIKEEEIKKEKIKQDNKNIPTFEEFKDYAFEKKPLIDLQELQLKYDSWVVNGWKDGNDKVINNWRSKLLNTLPYIKERTITKPKITL